MIAERRPIYVGRPRISSSMRMTDSDERASGLMFSIRSAVAVQHLVER